MNPPRTFLDEAFHALAQPVMALRATVEMALMEPPEKLDSHQVLGQCLQLIDRLTREFAMVREIAAGDEPSALAVHDGAALLRTCAEEMSVVAHELGCAIHVDAEHTAMECDEKKFRRAVFVLLDGMLAALPEGGEIGLQLDEDENGLHLSAHPALPGGLRQKLCWKLMQSAGGTVTDCTDSGTTVLFRKADARQLPVTPLAHKQSLTTF